MLHAEASVGSKHDDLELAVIDDGDGYMLDCIIVRGADVIKM